MSKLLMLVEAMMALEPGSSQYLALSAEYNRIATNNGGNGVIPTPQKLRNQRQTRILKRRNNTHK